MTKRRLGVGFIGSGSRALAHLHAWQAARDHAEVLGCWSPTAAQAAATAALARQLDVGNAKPYRSITAMVADQSIDALWICGATGARVENMEELADAVIRAKGRLIGVACETPLARNVTEAHRMVELAAHAGLKHGYLESLVFAPPLTAGRTLLWQRAAAAGARPHLARATEEHTGTGEPWFRSGDFEARGVSNDMLCHAALAVRFLLSEPGAPLAAIRPARVTARIASLEREQLDHDAAAVTVEFETESSGRVVGEATATWSRAGPGPRCTAELHGPGAPKTWSSLEGGDEALNRHCARVMLGHEQALLTFEDGLDVIKLLTAAYRSAQQARAVDVSARSAATERPND